ncbi:alpha-N-methyltransferase NTM1 [Bisporella sp. PMI_857]|nr:alpha-N-methyltransferase NTM1 [Bisporella sp. PMI_857]
MADSKINHQHAREYWESIDADVNGMLGGFPYISKVDLQGSKNFLAKLGVGGKGKEKAERAVDCGAGIGRTTEGLLLNIATTVDIVEPIAKFSSTLRSKPGIGYIYTMGLESWDPSTPYDLIWNQWCLGHLTDVQLQNYLQKCAKALKTGGWIIVKENMSTNGLDVFDELDSSVTRTDGKFRDIFESAGLVLKKTEIQRGLPPELYPVRIYALQPKTP